MRADTVTSGAPRNCGNKRSNISRRAVSFSCLSSSRSHLLTATTTARPSVSAKSAMRRSWVSNGMAASNSTTTTSANFTARMPSETDSFSSLSEILARLRMPAVSKIRNGTPPHSLCTDMASRVIPASGPVSSRSSPMILLIRVDLPALGRPITAICRGRSSVGLWAFASTSSSPSSASASVRSTSTSGLSCTARAAKASDMGRRI